MKLILAVAAAFVAHAALLPGSAHAAIRDSAEPSDPEAFALPHRADPGADAWWAGFNDHILGSLQRVARDRVNTLAPASAPPAWLRNALRTTDARTAVTYIGIRTMDMRLALQGEMQAAMRRRRQLLLAAGPIRPAAQALATLDARLAAAAQTTAGLQSSRASLLNTMVESTGMPSTLVESVLAGGGDAQAIGLVLPTFAASAQSVVSVAPSAAVRSIDARTAALSRDVAARQRQVDSAIARWKAGLASEHDALLASELLLSAEDQLSEAGGQLNLAWIDAYLQSLSGGAASPRRSDAGIGP